MDASHSLEARPPENPRQNPELSCPTCNRAFTRIEHLKRHQRIHTEETPFLCTICGKRFRRQDVFHRHSKNLCRGRASQQSSLKQRSAKACNSCRLQKLKCNGTEPCQRCTLKAITCSYAKNAAEPLEHSGDIPPPAINHPSSVNSFVNAFTPEPRPESLPTQVDNETFLMSYESAPGDVGGLGGDHSAFPSSRSALGVSSSADKTSDLTQMREPYLFGNDRFSMNLEFWPDLDKLYDPFLLNSDLVLPFSDPVFGEIDLADIEHLSPALSQQNVNNSFHDSMRDDPTRTRPSAGAPPWLQRLQPNIRFHDTEIMNYFLNKFMSHVAPILPTFQDFGNAQDQLPDVVLAMAAVGGLFCSIEGSFQISLSLYTDARRLALSRVLSSDVLPTTQATDLVQTFICLELFGFCSGDPRTFECTEAQHNFLLQTIDDYSLLTIASFSQTSALEKRLRLIESLCVLESYHVLLLQRPAHLRASAILSNITDSSSPSSQSGVGEAIEGFSRLLKSLMNPHVTLSPVSSSSSATMCLTVLAAMAGCANYGGDFMLDSILCWDRQLLELSLHRWFNSCQLNLSTQLSTVTIFHLIFMKLRTNMELVHKLARCHAGPSEDRSSCIAGFQEWQCSEDCSVSTLHAEQLLDAVKQSVVFGAQPRSGHNTPSRRSQQTHQHRPMEAPHLATSVYMATLVLWASAIARKKADWGLGRSYLETGVHILSYLKVRVATKIGNVLKQLIISHND